MRIFFSSRPDSQKTDSRKFFILSYVFCLLCSIFCLVLLSSCAKKSGGDEGDNTEEVSPGEMDVQVKTAKIAAGEMPVMVKAVGVLAPAMQTPAIVVALIPGIVSKVEVTEGQMVESGTVIIRLDARKADNAMAKANAGLRLVESALQKASQGGLDIAQSELDLEARGTEAAAEQARLDADRQNSLLAEHLISEKAAFDAQKALEEADRRLRRQKIRPIFSESTEDKWN
jgi:multidrug efflux pump subunit AcrA (membrane-fusion protein)